MHRSSYRLLAAALVLFFARTAPCAEPAKAEQVPDRVAEGYGKIAEKYGIEIVLADLKLPAQDEVTGRVADVKDLTTYLPLFAAEWNFYPVELVKRSGLRRIVLCEELALAGHRVAGLGGGGRKNNELYLDVGAGRWTRHYTRQRIHHEFFHVMDYKMHQLVGLRHGLADPKWAALNGPDFKYDKSIKEDPNAVTVDHTLPGFINRYGMSNVQEDKAVLYAHMVMIGQILDNRTEKDSVLKAKMDRMKEMLKEFCPQADDEFWKAARKVTRLGGG